VQGVVVCYTHSQLFLVLINGFYIGIKMLLWKYCHLVEQLEINFAEHC